MSDEKRLGIVKWFSDEKGYGFIEASEGGEEFFVHSTQVMDGSLAQGQRVEFEVGEGKKGPAAQNVTSAE